MTWPGRSILRGVLVATASLSLAAMRADEFGTGIDLTSFGREAAQPASVWDDLPLQDVGRRFDTAPRRVYVSAMLGPSFAQVNSPATSTLLSEDTLLAAGGAIGIAFERHNGRLRLETEAMGRGTYDAEFLATPAPGDTTILTNNWSVMENVWRDYMLTDRFGVYGGGGIGAGGYILGEQPAHLRRGLSLLPHQHDLTDRRRAQSVLVQRTDVHAAALRTVPQLGTLRRAACIERPPRKVVSRARSASGFLSLGTRPVSQGTRFLHSP